MMRALSERMKNLNFSYSTRSHKTVTKKSNGTTFGFEEKGCLIPDRLHEKMEPRYYEQASLACTTFPSED